MEAPQMRSKLLAPAALMLSVLSIAATPIAAGAQPYDHDRRDRDHAPRHKVWVCKDPHRAANTGTVVGVCCNIFGEGFPPKFVNDFTWGKERYTFEKVLQDIDNWKKFKGQHITQTEINNLEILYKQST